MGNVKEFPKRKHPRLKKYDYRSSGYYFVTICVKDRKNLLGKLPVGRDDPIPPSDVAVMLTNVGKIIDSFIRSIDEAYDNISLDCYVIMPDHLHILLYAASDMFSDGGMGSSRPTLDNVVCALKRLVTARLGYSVFQESFYEHIIRNEEDLNNKRAYIRNNPRKRLMDINKQI